MKILLPLVLAAATFPAAAFNPDDLCPDFGKVVSVIAQARDSGIPETVQISNVPPGAGEDQLKKIIHLMYSDSYWVMLSPDDAKAKVIRICYRRFNQPTPSF